MVSRGTLSAASLAAVLGAGAFAFAAVAPVGTPDVPPALDAAARGGGPPASPATRPTAQRLVQRNPFRAARRPAATPYDPATFGQPEAPPLPRPTLTLLGIIDGAEPTAVIEGLPGVEGPRVMRVGDEVGALRVTRIARAEVQIVGMDTTWVLKVREPWR